MAAWLSTETPALPLGRLRQLPFSGLRGSRGIARSVEMEVPSSFFTLLRHAAQMYGVARPKGPVDTRRQTLSTGSVGLIPPTLDVTRTGQSETVEPSDWEACHSA